MTGRDNRFPSRLVRDQRSGAIRSWFDSSFRPQLKSTDAPVTIARGVLADSANLFKWSDTLPDIADNRVIVGPSSVSVRLCQKFKNLTVDSSDIVVNFDALGTLHSIYNAYHYDIPDSLDPREVKLTAADANSIASGLMAHYKSQTATE